MPDRVFLYYDDAKPHYVLGSGPPPPQLSESPRVRVQVHLAEREGPATFDAVKVEVVGSQLKAELPVYTLLRQDRRVRLVMKLTLSGAGKVTNASLQDQDGNLPVPFIARSAFVETVTVPLVQGPWAHLDKENTFFGQLGGSPVSELTFQLRPVTAGEVRPSTPTYLAPVFRVDTGDNLIAPTGPGPWGATVRGRFITQVTLASDRKSQCTQWIYIEDLRRDEILEELKAQMKRQLTLSDLLSADSGFSWVPRFDGQVGLTGWTCRHQLTGKGLAGTPREFFPEADDLGSLRLSFPAARSHEAEALAVEFPLPRRFSKDEGFYLLRPFEPGITIFKDEARGIRITSPSTPIRVGALDLLPFRGEFQSKTKNQQLHWDLRPRQDTGKTQLSAELLSFELGLVKALPAGQDAIDQEAFPVCQDGSTTRLDAPEMEGVLEDDIDCQFGRSAPIVIALDSREKSTQARLSLEVLQRASLEIPRRIELTLRALDESGPEAAVVTDQVVVLDAEPFLVARLQYPSLSNPVANATSNELANWSNFGADRNTWHLRLTESPTFTLTLPPQAVGETMEKRKTLPDDAVADFRFGPPATLNLQERYYRRNFPEAPWNLRRLLADSSRELPGAHLVSLQFELLYGLACSIGSGSQRSFLRLAELAALVGVPQGPLPQLPRWGIREGGNYYKKARIEWAKRQAEVRQRLGIFEAWDLRRLAAIDLKEGVSCWIRDSRDRQENGGSVPPGPEELSSLQLPPAELAHPLDAKNCGSGDLCGGVTWGFESRNIYNAVMSPQGEWPKASGAQVNDLRLSALGGYGHQMAAFDYWRTKIYADVAMGRTSSYSVERIGRIACFWNRAKHVIVYERTVLPSRQQLDPRDTGESERQYRLEGRAVVRKVAEYVEILQNLRPLPDGDGVDPRTTSFIRACKFADDPNRVVRFPVSSDWGVEVGAIGWRIPIWQPGASPTDIYPRPVVHVTVLSSEDGESRPRDLVLANPENLYFYTDTRPPKVGGSEPSRDLSNTDEWAPVEGVDFVDLPRPAPMGEFGQTLDNPIVGDESNVPAGFGPCTFTLEPSTHKVDLLAERKGDPMGAALGSVTICRAALRSPAQSPGSISRASRDLQAGLAKFLEARRQELPQSPSAADVKNLFQCEEIGSQFGEWMKPLAEVRAKVQALNPTVASLLAFLDDEAVKAIAERLERQLSYPEGFKDELLDKAKAIEAIDVQIDHAISSLVGLPRPGSYLAIPLAALEAAAAELARAVEISKSVNVMFAGFASSADVKAEESLALLDRYRGKLQLSIDRALTMSDSGPQAAGKAGLEQLSYRAWVLRLLEPAQRAISDAARLVERMRAWAGAEPKRRDALLAGLRKGTQSLVDQGEILKACLSEPAEQIQTLLRTLEASPSERLHAIGESIKEQLVGFVETTNDFQKELAGKWQAVVDGQIKALVEDLNQKLPAMRTQIGKISEFEACLDRTLPTADTIRDRVRESCDLFSAEVDRMFDELGDLATSKLGLDEIDAFVRRKSAELQMGVEARLGPGLREARRLEGEYEAKADQVLDLVRAFGKPPDVSGLAFDRPEIAFFYDAVQDHVDISPVVARAAQVSAVDDALKPLGVDLPVKKLGEQLIPAELKNFDLSSILPNVSGVPLRGLFSGIKMPDGAQDRVKVRHGVDPHSRKAWVNVEADFMLAEPATLFALGPLALSLDKARFRALSRLEADTKGVQQRRVEGSLEGDWHLQIGGFKLVTFRATALRFDENGKLLFDVEPRNVEMPEALKFVNDLLAGFSKGGLSVRIDATGVSSILDVPIPDTKIGAFGYSGLRLGARLSLGFFGGFNIGLAACLGRMDAPFNLTICVLGGAGYLVSEARYFPETGKVESTTDMAIAVSASLGIALGPISGSVSVFVGVTANYNSKTGGGLNVGMRFMVVGQVSVLSMASAHIVLSLHAQYQGGRLVGTGSVSIRLKICWCFTLEVEEAVTYTLGGEGSRARLDEPRPVAVLASLSNDAAYDALQYAQSDLRPFDGARADDLVKQYLEMVTEGFSW